MEQEEEYILEMFVVIQFKSYHRIHYTQNIIKT
jgi:hypothetical protein